MCYGLYFTFRQRFSNPRRDEQQNINLEKYGDCMSDISISVTGNDFFLLRHVHPALINTIVQSVEIHVYQTMDESDAKSDNTNFTFDIKFLVLLFICEITVLVDLCNKSKKT